jgi:hypothetical protein
MNVLETSNVEKVVTDAFHGVEQLIEREKAIPAVQAVLRKVHEDIREAKNQLASCKLAIGNLKDALQSLEVCCGGVCIPPIRFVRGHRPLAASGPSLPISRFPLRCQCACLLCFVSRSSFSPFCITYRAVVLSFPGGFPSQHLRACQERRVAA